MRLSNHWLSDCLQTPSPNYDDRPDPDDISLVVIHCISLPPGVFGAAYIDRLFCNTLDPNDHPYFQDIYRLRVSAHLLIGRDGRMTQYVPFDKRAWHAGLSEYRGRNRCNDFSIGIELEGTETTPYTDEQYRQLAGTLTCLFKHYPKLSKDSLAGHSDIAPDRKTDPGASFDWQRLFSLL
ncbi:MAG: 1,6-anhydro-N-acetylmuramyl-L-alanine amidase AmpD [Methylomicrobium sp.]